MHFVGNLRYGNIYFQEVVLIYVWPVEKSVSLANSPYFPHLSSIIPLVRLTILLYTIVGLNILYLANTQPILKRRYDPSLPEKPNYHTSQKFPPMRVDRSILVTRWRQKYVTSILHSHCWEFCYIYMNFHINLTQFNINFSRQEHQI